MELKYDLPQGWKYKPILDVAEISGKSLLPEDSTVYNFVGLEHIESNTGKLIGFEPTMGKNIKSTKVTFLKGMVLYGKLRPYLNKVWVAEFDGVATTEILPFSADGGMLIPKYLAYYLRSPEFVATVDLNTSGARMPRATSKFFNDVAKIPLPPLPEQTRIVAKLDALFERIDQAIGLLEKNIRLTGELMAAVLGEVFGKLKGDNSIVKPVEKIAEVKGGKRIPLGTKLSDEKTNHPYLRVTDFNERGSIEMNSLKYISESIFSQIRRYTITSNDLYISIAGTIGRTGIIPKELDGANLTENAAKLVIKQPDKLRLKYLFFFTLSTHFKEQAGLATKAVAMPKLALTRLQKIQVPIPSIDVQENLITKFEILTSMNEKLIEAQTQKLRSLQVLKSSLLDQAFRGEL